MASPTLKELAERIEALEADSERIAALGRPGGIVLDRGDTGPMRDAYEVRSEVTGATIGCHDSYEDATDEADRLNAESRRDGIKHLGKRMTYEVVKVRVTDEAAVRELRIAELEAQLSDPGYQEVHKQLAAELEALVNRSG